MTLVPAMARTPGMRPYRNNEWRKPPNIPEHAFNVNDEGVLEGSTPKWPRDKKKYCDFHKNYGHDTLDCVVARKVLIEKYKNGELKNVDLGPPPQKKEFNNNRTRGNPSPKRGRAKEDDNDVSQAKPRIDYIMGGSKFCRDSINSIRHTNADLKVR